MLSNTVADTFGHYPEHEGFLELGLPLLRDKFLARSLDLNAAGRISRCALTGTVKTWKLGMTWQPIESLRLRMTRAHGIQIIGTPNVNLNRLAVQVFDFEVA